MAKSGGLVELCAWSRHRILLKKAKIIKIVKARPGEKSAKIVFEITVDGIFPTPHGRTVRLSALKKSACRDG